jgi:hypothetical protein
MAMDLTHGAVSFGSGLIAGAMNSVAGGGTLLTFPTLIWLGLNSVTANATSTVAVWPGQVSGMFGGLFGAVLLRLTPSTLFDRLVPYLILFATVLFMVQEPIQRRIKRSHPHAHKSASWFLGAVVFQFMVGVYGGYFGAGIGILMLAAFSILGMTDIHQMNGFKNLLGGAVNALAAIYFISQKMVYWPDVGVMALGAVAGGYAGAGTARKLGRTAVRRIAILIGFGMAVSLFIKH